MQDSPSLLCAIVDVMSLKATQAEQEKRKAKLPIGSVPEPAGYCSICLQSRWERRRSMWGIMLEPVDVEPVQTVASLLTE